MGRLRRPIEIRSDPAVRHAGPARRVAREGADLTPPDLEASAIETDDGFSLAAMDMAAEIPQRRTPASHPE